MLTHPHTVVEFSWAPSFFAVLKFILVLNELFFLLHW